MAKDWISSAIKHPGELKARASAAGVTLGQYMAAPHRSPEIKKEINLAKTLRSFKKGK
jgi:mannitol/fructose-specific phosphotransferase system IIA component